MRLVALILLSLSLVSHASNLTFGFGNPSFSGEGYSSHVLSLEQLQYNRAQSVQDDLTAAEKAAERAAKNTTLAKFITNVESRIYANLSKQMVDNMFGTNCDVDEDTVIVECPDDGESILTDGSKIVWVKDNVSTPKTIKLTITDPLGGITELIVPLGDFKF